MSIDKDQLLTTLVQSENLELEGVQHTQARHRGLPDRDALRDLARTYLDEQRRLWPDLVGTDLLPEPTDAILDEMACQFERVYLSGELPLFESRATLPEGVSVGAVYSRYSDSNSNPRSLNQQLRNELRGAARDRVFAPWEFVLADAAVTGTNDHRRGYQLLKALIVRQTHPIECIFIDELGRASRDHIESLILGRLVDWAEKRLVGFSDNFDSSNAMSKIMLSVFSMLHELFVDQLREKVARGMNDAFEQGKHLYKPGFGYSLVAVRGDDGEPVYSADGKRVQQVVVEPDQAEHVRRIFRLYADEDWSPQRIARRFNEDQIGDEEKWTSTQIRNMLKRHVYQGREPWGKTTKRPDPSSGKVKTVNLPEKDWKWRDMPHLRIVDQDLWDRAQARMAKLSRAYDQIDDSITRGEGHAKRLLHLFCHCCGTPLWADRGGERPIVRCMKGRDGVDGCTAKGSKTLKHIEESLLNHVLGQLADQTFVDEIVVSANECFRRSRSDPSQM